MHPLSRVLAAVVLSAPACAAEQIDWQRSLPDAVALAEAEGRPLLIAVNMDGESASERIVVENYRDPAFVAATRRYVCLVSSVFRHTPRDHDARGRRIPCPRLGAVTCGEHIALEPVLYERYLGGERIAPRHAVILPGGELLFDLSLLFDLNEIDRAVARAAVDAPPPADRESGQPATLPAAGVARQDAWRQLAWARTNRGRDRFEEMLATAELTPADLDVILAELRASGDAGSLAALRVLAARAGRHGDPWAARLAEVANARSLADEFRALLYDVLAGNGDASESPGLGPDSVLLEALGQVAGDDAGARTVLLSHLAATAGVPGAPGSAFEHAGAGLAHLLGPAAQDLVDAASARGGPFRLDFLVQQGFPPPGGPTGDRDPRAEDEVLDDLDEVLTAMQGGAGDPALQKRLALDSLRMAKLRIDAGGPDVDVFLQDAALALDRAQADAPDDPILQLARAELSHRQGDFAAQERAARAACALLVTDAEGDAISKDLLDAIRWHGDACIRLHATRAGGDPEGELTGIHRALSAYLWLWRSPAGNPTDQISLTSFLGMLGRPRARLALARLGVQRFPESVEVRNELNAALWTIGRPDLVAGLAAETAALQPASAFCAWYEGFGRVFHAEWLRRQYRTDDAGAEYRAAAAAFAAAEELNPAYAASCRRYRATCALGLGFTHLLANEQAEAAACLVQAIRTDPEIAGVRDGLDREAIDLLDGALEWRLGGASPVQPQGLLASVLDADPGNADWGRRVADTALREALRAEGRGDEASADAWLADGIAVGRRAVVVEANDETQHALAQVLTVLAERKLARGEEAGVLDLLAEAGPLMGIEPFPPDATGPMLRETTAKLRAALGEPRPISRPGR